VSNSAPVPAIPPARACGDLRTELRQVRSEARARYSEVDLLVAALRDHIRDLQGERDALRAERDTIRAELERVRQQQVLRHESWPGRGLRPQH